MKRKKILLVAPPYRGHLHPLLGIGRRLSSMADVTVVSTPRGVAAAKAAGLSGCEVMVAHESEIWAIVEPGCFVKNHPLLLYRQLKSNVAIMLDFHKEFSAICKETSPDLVIADFTIPVAGIVATDYGIPWWTTMPSPCVLETPDGPPAYFGGQIPATTLNQRMLHALLRAATRLFKRLVWVRFWKQFRAMGYKRVYREDGSESIYSPLKVLGLSAAGIEFPRTYPKSFKLIGPVLYGPEFTGDMPDFSDTTAVHLLITIGTHLPHAKEPLVATMKGLAQRHPQIVFHFSHGKAMSTSSRRESNFHEYSYIDYEAHLSRYHLVVHHGGSGVMNHCLRHGIPTVVYPHDYDQFDCAARMVYHGLAYQVKAADELEDAMLRALADAELHERCKAFAEIHQTYDAEGEVLALVEALEANR